MVNRNSKLSVSMATSDSPQHRGDTRTSLVAMEEGPLHEWISATAEGRLREELDATTTASATTATAIGIATTNPPRTDCYGFLPSNESKSIKDELVELFLEVMDFNRQRNWKKKVLAFCMGVCTVFVVVDLVFLGNILCAIHKFAAWMSLHIFPGTLLFIVLLTCCTLIMIPPSILIFVCGFVFAQVSGALTGIPAAVLVSFAGCAVGAILAFLRARYMMRDLFELFSKRYKIFRAVDRALKHDGFRVMVLLRLCPIIPFNGLNYFGGVTSISMEQYVFALVGTLPLIILTVVAGAGAESLVVKHDMTADGYAIRRIKIVAGLIFALVAVIITLYKAKKELIRELEAERDDDLPASNGLPVDGLSVVPAALDVRPQNREPASGEMTTTKELKQMEPRSLPQFGRRDFRTKLNTRKPDLLRSSSMPNVMAKGGKKRRQRSSLRGSSQTAMPNIMITPARKSTRQRSQHGVSEWTSMRDSENFKLRSNIERASSARDVTASTRSQKSHRALIMEKKQTSERTLLGVSRRSSESNRIDDTRMLPKQLIKPGTKVELQALNANPALNGQTVNIAKFLENDNHSRFKPRIVEAADAMSMNAVSSLPAHKWKVVPATAHATRRPLMPESASSQRSATQSRKSDPHPRDLMVTPSQPLSSKAKRPAYQTSKSESFLGVIC